MLVEETLVINPLAPWRKPEAVRLVPEALVKNRLGKLPYPLAVMFVLDTSVKVGLTEIPMSTVPVAETDPAWMLVPEALTVRTGWLEVE